jgi:hypothetical protein
MLMSKLKTGTALVLFLSAVALGVGAGSYQLLASEVADAKQGRSKAPVAVVTVEPANEEEADGQLPTGPAPSQALVSLGKDGRFLFIRTAYITFQPVEAITRDGTRVATYRTMKLMRTQPFHISDIRVLDARGKKIAKGQLPELLKEETPAFIYSGPQEMDPLHLRLIKEDTLVFVLPYSAPVTPPAPVYYPVADPLAPAVPFPAPKQEKNKENPKSGQASQPAARVGEIRIVGNENTSDDIILKGIALLPGQVLNYDDLKKAERKLERLGLFELDAEKGVRPTITVINSDGLFKDILVTVKEKVGAAKKER